MLKATSILVFMAVLILSACQSSQDDRGNLATLTVSVPGYDSQAAGHSPASRLLNTAKRVGVPAEVTSLLIEVLNSASEVLDSAEIVGTEGTVSLSIAGGNNYTVRGRAFAGAELLFRGETAVDRVIAGSTISVSLTLQDQVLLNLTALGDRTVGSGESSIGFTLDGLQNTTINWYINGVAGGTAEFGLIDANGVYTPPAVLPLNPLIQVMAEPAIAPSFAQSFSFTLLPPVSNSDPVANAGADQNVSESTLVTLDGRASTDADGSIVSYSWSLISGSGITLNDAASATASFTAPVVVANQVAEFELTVTDDDGSSSTDRVVITIFPINVPPVSDAGADQAVNEQTGVTLSAVASSDIDGSIVSYQWLQTSGTSVILSNSSSVNPTFTAPILTLADTLVFELTVTDNESATHVDTVAITVSPVNATPVANAGADQTVDEQSNVTLSGAGSSDADGSIVSYQWRQLSGVAAVLSNSAIVNPNFVAPTLTVADTLVFELTVTDNESATRSDTVAVTVNPVNAIPVANAGVDQTVNALEVVSLSAAASNDTDGSIVGYSWVRISNDLAPILNNPATVSPSFTAPSVQFGGSVTYRLTVTDNEGATAVDEVTITVNGTDQPLVANAGSDQVVDEFTVVTLDASGSDDPDNAITAYLWEELTNGGIVITNPTAQLATFTAPDVDASTDFQFRLTVTNDNADQALDTVTVTVNNVVPVVSNVFFAATTDSANYYLWTSDGTEVGTRQVATVALQNSDLFKYKTIGGFFYFSGNDGINGNELWRSDGTVVGTETLPSAADAAYGGLGAGADANPVAFSVLGDRLLYEANTSHNGVFYFPEYLSLNTVDSNLTTVFAGDVASFEPVNVGTLNGFSYFYVNVFTPTLTTTLYRSDGINPATVVRSYAGFFSLHDFTEVNGELFFVLGNNQLWKTDGTETGTVLVKTFSGHVGKSGNFSGENNMASFDSQLFFVADDGQGRELWKSDGSGAGTVLVADLDASPTSTNPTEFKVVNGVLTFLSSQGSAATDGIWASDGTAVGTQRLAALAVNEDVGFYAGNTTGISQLVDSLNLLFFSANDGINGSELWVTDGTAVGTRLVKNISTTGDAFPAMFRPGDGFLLFSAQDDEFRAKLWRTDGTEVGTTMIKDILPTGFDNQAFFQPGG